MRYPQDVPRLSDGTVTLRAHDLDDVPGCMEQSLDPVSRLWTTVPVPYTVDDAHRFIGESIPDGWRTDREWAFAVEADGRYGGTVSLRNREHQRAEIAFGAHPDVRGRGVMERALRLLLDWGFEVHDLRTVLWMANRGNWASRKLAWRLGFAFEGTLHQWLPHRDELVDAWTGQLLRGDARLPRHPWLPVPRIEGEGVVLRAFRAPDAVRLREALSDERATHWLGHLPLPFSPEAAEGYVEERHEHAARGSGVHFAVADPRTDELLGNVSAFQIRPGWQAEVGYFAHPDARGRGVIGEAVALLVRHCFVPVEDGGLGLRRLYLLTAVENTASRHVAEVNGFTLYGVERGGTIMRDRSLVDTACYDLLPR
ncbi:MAG: GNAT family N-acetyltransferase [Nocardioidaceae bacterium]